MSGIAWFIFIWYSYSQNSCVEKFYFLANGPAAGWGRFNTWREKTDGRCNNPFGKNAIKMQDKCENYR